VWLCECASLVLDEGLLGAAMDDSEAREDAIGLLVPTGERLLRAGVVISVSDWLRLTDLERVAMAIAGRRIMIEKAMLTAQAAQGPQAAAAVFAEIDGGEMHDDLMLDRAMSAGLTHFGGS